MASTSKALLAAISIHNAIKRYGPMDIHSLIMRVGLEEREVRQGLRFSARNLDPAILANEIVGLTRDNLYFLSQRDGDLNQYKGRRARIAMGHLDGLWSLLSKEQEKYPAAEKAWTITQVDHLRQSLATIRFGDDENE